MVELQKNLQKTQEHYVTNVMIVTLDDNIQHSYFSAVRWSKNNNHPISEAQLIMPYDKQIASYWEKYPGSIVISGKLSSQKINTNGENYFTNVIQKAYKKSIEKNKIMRQKNKQGELTEDQIKKQNEQDNKKLSQRLINENYNYSYIGKVSRFEQKGKKFIIYLEDLGWKFSQKVPKEFRDTFIANQSLDDAFQAICEFMGIEFAYSIEDLHEYTFAADGYSITKDGQTIEDVPSILKEWAPDTGQNEEEPDDTENNNSTDNKKKKNNTSKSSNQKNSSLASSSVNQAYAPTSGNKNVTTADMEGGQKKDGAQENKQDDKQSVQEKIEKYQEEFDEKIKDLFIGNTYYESNVSDPILNYDWIRITPKAPTSSTTNTNTQGSTNNTQNNNQNNQNKNNSNNSSGSNNLNSYIDSINSRGYI